MLTIFLLIIATCLIVLLVITYNKLKDEQYKYLLLTKKVNQLKNSNNTRNKKSNKNIIRFIPTVYKNGVISKNCKLMISPLDDSIDLRELRIRDSVDILDKCECNSIIWFYVKVYDNSEMNNKGWVISHNINTSLENVPKKRLD
ncbi:MAG: hypothetical protein AB6733_21625 [Clostridiaceae bacterium]